MRIRAAATVVSPALDPGSLLPAPSPPSPPAAGWRAALTFFAVLIALALPDLLAQGASRTAGLAWSELSTMLLPALVATAGSNLRVGSYLGLARPRPQLVVLGAVMGAAGFVAANGVMALWMMVLPRRVLEWFPDVGRIFEGPLPDRAAMIAVAAVLAPVCEELAFRGYLQRTLLRDLSPAAAIGLGALLFSVRHLDPVRLPALLGLGALFGWLAWRGGSVWLAVTAHAVNNVLAIMAALQAGSTAAAPPPWEALAPLAIGGAVIAGLGIAFHRMAPPLPPPPADVPRRDPADPSTRFRAYLVPTPLVAAASAGAVSLLVLLLTAAL